MSSDYFARWDNFDADAALGEVDAAEIAERRQLEGVRAKEEAARKRNAASEKVAEESDVLEARAAVAALRAKRRGGRGKRGQATPKAMDLNDFMEWTNDEEGMDKREKEEEAAKAAAAASAARRRRDLMQTTLGEQNEAADMVRRAKEENDESRAFELLRNAAVKLETSVASVTMLEDDFGDERIKSATAPLAAVPAHACGEGASCNHNHGNDLNGIDVFKSQSEGPMDETELIRVIITAEEESRMMLAACRFRLREYAECVDILSDLLSKLQKRGRGSVSQAKAAWILRGEAYLEMGAPLLGELNVSQSLHGANDQSQKELIERANSASRALHSMKRDERVLAAEKAITDAYSGVSDPWALAARAMKEAETVLAEGFYMSAYVKCAVSLRLAERAGENDKRGGSGAAGWCRGRQ